MARHLERTIAASGHAGYAGCVGSGGTAPISGRFAPSIGANAMFSWAILFLIVALVAAVLGFTGLAGTAVNIAWILFVVGLILFVVFAVMGRRGPGI
jgi:uncharacterized membrane protein YtjA (UPF0391 family)